MAARVSEPPKGSLFTFKQYGCKCNVEKHYEDNGSESYWLQITANNDNEIELFHDFKNGLYKSDAVDIKLKDIVHELPQSGELKKLIKYLSDIDLYSAKTTQKIIMHNEETYANEIKTFFERFGFLFPLTERATLVSVQELSLFLDRLYVVSQLISEIKGAHPVYGYNYDKIFNYVFILSLSNDRMLRDSKHENKVIYTIPAHTLSNLLRSVPEKHNRPHKKIYLHQYTKSMHYELLKNAFEEHDLLKKERGLTNKTTFEFFENRFSDADDRRIAERLKTFEESINDSTVCYIVRDYVANKYVGKAHDSESDNDEVIKAFIDASQFSIQILESHYENMNQNNREDKLFVDFLLNFCNEVAMIFDICGEEFSPLFSMNYESLNHNMNFGDNYKEALLELARLTIKNEMDEILKSVLPKFDAKEMAPGWYVPDLFTAINYSLFLNAGNEKIEKSCANPTCYQTFSVEIGNSKHQYCSDSCSNCMRQRRHKANKAARDAENSTSKNA